ncbi:MAG: radical SAM protein [Bacteroidales bacterium]|nr:radical SAM protein [Bacteroidales bacterium]
MKNKKKIFISAEIACPFRTLDAAKLKHYFTLNNYEIIDSYKKANYYIYITCSATNPIVQTELKTIQEFNEPSCELIVLGCLPGANQEELKNIFSGKAIATNNIQDIDTFFPDFKIKFEEVPEANQFDSGNYVFLDTNPNASFFKLLLKYGMSATLTRKLHRHHDYKNFESANEEENINETRFLKICSGCTNNCSYCNIREAIGKIKSRSIASIKSDYSKLLIQGNRLFHFVAEDICSYGYDINSSLTELLNTLSDFDKKFEVKWSLEGLHPTWLVKNQKDLFPFIKSKKIWEITTSVEHGSDRILSLMNRHYKINDVKKVLNYLRTLNPGIKLNCMLILGFPSETEEDFEEVLELLKSIRFDDVLVTEYSEFSKRASSKIFPKVPKEVVQERLSRTNQILQKLKTPLIIGDK